MKVRIIDVNQEETIEEVQVKNKLKYFQEIVDGYIETIKINEKEIMIVEGEGKLKHKSYNIKATDIVSKVLNGDYIAGFAIIVNKSDFINEDN